MVIVVSLVDLFIIMLVGGTGLGAGFTIGAEAVHGIGDVIGMVSSAIGSVGSAGDVGHMIIGGVGDLVDFIGSKVSSAASAAAVEGSNGASGATVSW